MDILRLAEIISPLLIGVTYVVCNRIRRAADRRRKLKAAELWAIDALHNKFWRMMSGLEPPIGKIGILVQDLQLFMRGLEIPEEVDQQIQIRFLSNLKVYLDKEESIRHNRANPCWSMDNQRLVLWIGSFIRYIKDYGSRYYGQTLDYEFMRRLIWWKRDGLERVLIEIGPIPTIISQQPVVSERYLAIKMWLEHSKDPLAAELTEAHRMLDKLRPFRDDAEIAMLIARYEAVVKSVAQKTSSSSSFSELEEQANAVLRSLEKQQVLLATREAFSELASSALAYEEVTNIRQSLK